MLKAARGIGMDIFWHRPLKKMENAYMYTESASYTKRNSYGYMLEYQKKCFSSSFSNLS